MNKNLNIAVLLGGPSAERDVSLRSGGAVAKALRSLGHCVTEVDPKDRTFTLPPHTDVVFLALHGTYGEDGTVQTELEKLGVPYTGCDPEASRIAFDKVLTKKRCVEAGVPTAKFEFYSDATVPWPNNWQPPVILKPVRQGSSVGLQFVNHVSEWSEKLVEALKYDSEVLMEEKIIGRETTVGILDGKPLPVVEVRVKQGEFDYKNKYTPGASEHFCPADFDEETTRRIQQAALGAFNAIGGRDYSRVDVMVKENGDPVVLEVNTLPGMTETSLLPDAAKAAEISYEQLCQRMVELALRRKK
ncbi:MAG: D-alanine--D-alanine ligase [Verrucomicrobia bacterium]|nr:D-alanine--D-alanine ligase [Verrucomicrobiota bacterium]